jgi:uncharacterized membrane protein
MLRQMTAAAGLSVAAGLALVEVVMVPAVVIGGAAALTPKYLRRLARPRTGQKRVPGSSNGRQPQTSALPKPRNTDATTAAQAGFGLKQAVVKTITFRAIVTTLDFTTNYVVIGEFATAAGLSTFNLVAGPVFYLAHEAVWNYWGPSGATVDVAPAARAQGDLRGWYGFAISRALAKTITFRTIASVMDFTTNYVVVGDVATAAGLSAFGFFLGPFVYFGHEKLWDYFAAPNAALLEQPTLATAEPALPPAQEAASIA